MRYTIIISVAAEQDLSCIYSSIAVNNESIANKVLNEFYNKIVGLEYFPFRYPKLSKTNKEVENIRVTYLYKYYIIYKIDDLNKIVYIYRIVYCAKDIKKIKIK